MALLQISKKSRLITRTLADDGKALGMDFDEVFSTTKIENRKPAMKKMTTLEQYKPTNKLCRRIRNTVLYILDQHVYDSNMLSDNCLKNCSEQSLIIKFWSYAFEQLLGSGSDVFLQWGDTLSSQAKDIGAVSRLDLRIIIYNQTADIEASTGEFANHNTINKSKLYGDRLKSVLASKVHLNYLLSSMKSLSGNDVKTIKLPVIQVMGLSCYVYSLCLVDQRLYYLRNVCEFTYPRTFQQLKNGVLDKFIGGLLKIRGMLSDVKWAMGNYNRNTSNNMKNILEEKKKSPTFSTINLSHWTTPLIPIGSSNSGDVDNAGTIGNSNNNNDDDDDDDDDD
ncbi:hypothetical protein DFQ28_009056 [Apophysomyces sp. BC1034]|nr:hypothetical protein DFQ30_007645 [Apophysomyces sp. BC1015]KAG0176766.1 hypothetical protein DFQ29_005672 [Apophysomyces sp. BC1021]KAG0185624.1 hypothetical protein DFQ28_009056 [Apophysomyces sp. BC1034]